MTAIPHKKSTEHDTNAWEHTVKRIAAEVVHDFLKERSCNDECGALIRMQEQLHAEQNKHFSTEENIKLIFKKIEHIEGNINKLVLDVAKGSTNIVASIIISVIVAIISKALKMW
jgi:hypothetical protein